MLKRFFIHILFYLIALHTLWAQDYKPNGNFLADSVRIGEPVLYTLSFSHPRQMELFFPDSNYAFSPFEFIRKEYFPTQSGDSMSLDSVVYTLRSFEIRNSADLALPVFIIDQGDTSKIFPVSDRIHIHQYIKTMPDSLILKSNSGYTEVAKKFNYPYFIAVSIGIIITLIFSYLIFGKTILRNYRLYVMQSNHEQFVRDFSSFQDDLSNSPNQAGLEQALGEWKNYLARIEQKPINTFTTTEIISLFSKEELKESLQTIDRSIYGGLISEDVGQALEVMKKFSNKRYKKRRKELRNAR